MSASPRANRVTCHGLQQASRGILNQGSWRTPHRVPEIRCLLAGTCARGQGAVLLVPTQTLDRPTERCPLYGVREDA
jgi:hypothetical protein